MSRCTNCNRPVKPVVAIDIDGTLGQYHDHFLQFAEGWLGTRFPEEYKGYESLSDFMGITKDVYRQCKLAYRQGGLKRTMPVYKGAKELVDGLREAGAEVWLTTTRPYLRLDNVDPDTREWCGRNGIIFDGLLYDEDKYKTFAEIVGEDRVVGVLEDLPDLVNRAKELRLNPLLIRRPHNSYLRREILGEVGNLHAAQMMLTIRTTAWLGAHHGR